MTPDRAILPLCTALTLVVLLNLFSAWVAKESDRPIAVTVRPRMAFAPADLSILIRLKPAASDRTVRVWTDGLGYARSSAWTIEGEQSPKVYTVDWWKVYPADEYDVIASVADQRGLVRASATERVFLTSP